MRFLKISGRLPGFLSRLDYSRLKDPFRTSMVTIIYTDCRSTKTAVTVAYLNRSEESVEPIFPYQEGTFTAGRSTEALVVSPFEMLIITVLSSNPIDASFILRKVVDFIKGLDD